jgi:predicted PurR-regulated permease PerM
VFQPFLLTFTVAACVALLLAPAQRRLSRLLGGRPGIAAGLLVVLTTFVIFLPILGSFFLFADQAFAFFGWLAPRLEPQTMQQLWRDTLHEHLPFVERWLKEARISVAGLLSTGLARLATAANVFVQRLLAGLTTTLFNLLLFLLLLYFLLCDGSRLRAYFREVSPLSETQEREIFAQVAKTVQGVLLAQVVVPLAQGFLAAVGFWLFGVPSPVLWGVGVVFAAMVPILGSPLGWVPACVYLFLTGTGWQAFGMLAWGMVVISGIDNVLKPLLLRGTARLHPMPAFLSILGGVLAFGPAGVLVGPVILSLALSAVRIYRLDVLRAGPRPAPAPPRG